MTLLLLKFIHLLAAIVYFGNLTAACHWSRFAARIPDVQRLETVVAGVDRADKRLTVPGAAILVISGVVLAVVSGRSLASHWIAAALLLAAAVLWLLRFSAAPIKRSILQAARDSRQVAGAPEGSNFLADDLLRWRRRLDTAWLLSAVVLVLMVWQPGSS